MSADRRGDDHVRLAISGAGRAFERLYQPALARSRRMRLLAIADPLPARAALAGPAVRQYAGLGELLAAEEVDAVLVLTPARQHTTDVLLALECGHPTLAEKPICLEPAELARLNDAGADRLLRPALSRRWWPAYQPVRLRAAGAERLAFGIRSDPRLWDPVTREIDIVSDLLPHGFDLARWTTGADIVRVSASAGTTWARARLEMSGGQRFEVRASMRGVYLEVARVGDRTFHGGPPSTLESGWRRLWRRPDPGIGAIVEMLDAWAGIVRGGPAGDFPAFADGTAVAEATWQFRQAARLG
ncbi:MAG: Gfo/Idh/MocA family protein [Dehalococcoidia bacterium]